MNHTHSEDFLRMADEARKQITEVSPAEACKLVALRSLQVSFNGLQSLARYRGIGLE